jgi:hypothetical protein
VITANGRTFIKRYLAGQAGNVVGAISVGIGGTAATLNDAKLQFEFGRVPVAVTAYDFANDLLVFKGSLDDSLSGNIYEIGIWTAEVNSAAGNQQSRIITTFDSATEEWTNETMDTLVARIGVDALKHTPSASTSTSSVLSGLNMDFIDSSSLDQFVLAYNVDNANVASAAVRFRTDAANYYQFSVTSPTAGYKFSSFNKGSATVVGTPNWSDINEIEVVTTATAGGAASIEYDGLRLEDIDTIAPEYGLVARYVPAVPIVKGVGVVQDIEYALLVNI